MSETAGLLAAMLAVQGEAPTLPKDATNPHYRSKYTPLDTIVETIGPILHRHGLVWSTLPGTDAHGAPALTYRLAHAATGEVLEGTMPLLLSKQDAQGQGSAITYARRYALCAVLNLVADDDDDGASAAAGRGEGASHGDALASDAQKKFLRQLITQNRLDEGTVRRLFGAVGFAARDGEKVNDAINRLKKGQCSSLIEFIKEGAVPDGSTDVPAPEGFEHAPQPDDLFTPAEA
jgi:hypothetical protein